MRRTLVLFVIAAAALAAVAPASAAGASWKGVIVAKDNGRSAIVTASANGVVRTARSPRARSLRIGQRVEIAGRPLADGTFSATSVRATGRATTARLKAVVVRAQTAGRLLVSAGGSSFALTRRGATRTLAVAAEPRDPQAGTQIVAAVSLATGTPQATSVATVGRLGMLEVEGILTKLESGSLELLVARAGPVTLALPPGFVLPAGLAVFDPVKAIVSVGADGKLTVFALQGDEAEDRDDDGVDFVEDGDRLKVEGTVVSLSAASITVRPGSSATTVTCTLNRALTGFAVGARVEMECFADTAGTLVLRKIEREDDDEDDEDSDDSDDDSDDSDDSDD